MAKATKPNIPTPPKTNVPKVVIPHKDPQKNSTEQIKPPPRPTKSGK